MAGKKSEKRKYSHSQQLLDKRLGLLLMVPIAAVIFGITGIPFIRALYLSFTNKVVGVPEQFIGFDNYLALFGDKIYWKSLYNTIIYTVGCITAKLALGLLLAVILNQKFRGRHFSGLRFLFPGHCPEWWRPLPGDGCMTARTALSTACC